MNSINNNKMQKDYITKTTIILGSIILLRVIPHAANCVPIFALLTILVNNNKFTTKNLIFFVLVAIFISDYLLKVIYNYPILGNYSLFTYSGFVLIIFLQFSVANRYVGLLINTMSATLIYWLWTNFGVWLVDAIYPLTMQGGILCYTLALPFLKNSMCTNIIGVVLFRLLQMSNDYKYLRSHNIRKSNRINNSVF